jgi:hypothetical protein
MRRYDRGLYLEPIEHPFKVGLVFDLRYDESLSFNPA